MELDEKLGKVASVVIEAFSSLPKRLRTIQPHEWTVLAGFVAVENGQNFRLISLATGNKCLGPKVAEEGGKEVVKDLHAEVLAMRGLRRYFLEEVHAEKKFLLEEKTNGFGVRAGVELFLFVSEPPCGDCSVYSGRFSGAKLAHNPLQREDEQEVGAVRIKPFRRDLPHEMRSQILSCSDKIANRIIEGFEGKRCKSFLENPLRIHGMVLSSDCLGRENALQDDNGLLALKNSPFGPRGKGVSADVLESCWRGLIGRKQSKLPCFVIGISSNLFGFSRFRDLKVEKGTRKRKRELSASGLSCVWFWSSNGDQTIEYNQTSHQGHGEVLVQCTGKLERCGKRRKAGPNGLPNTSLISRASMDLQRATVCSTINPKSVFVKPHFSQEPVALESPISPT